MGITTSLAAIVTDIAAAADVTITAATAATIAETIVQVVVAVGLPYTGPSLADNPYADEDR